MKKQFEKMNVLVASILEDYPDTRDSDNLLYLTVIETIGRGNMDKPISEILLNLEELGLPCFETVRRTRQKIQTEREDLRATTRVRSLRSIREEEYKEYFRAKCHD